MSAAVTMQDLELEHAELLPNRETLWGCGCSPGFIRIDVDVDVDVFVCA